MKKNAIFLIVLVVIFISVVAVIGVFSNKKNENKEGKIEIIATLFPQYDFAKQIGKDKVNVTLLLPPGAESHTYEPTPQDIVKINKSNLFIYTGKEMEPWADNLIAGMKDNIDVLDLSTTVELIDPEEFEEKYENIHGDSDDGENSDNGSNDKESEYSHAKNVVHGVEKIETSNEAEKTEDSHEEGRTENKEGLDADESSHTEEHHHAYDPHIWLNPLYAIQMVRSIEEQLCKIDPSNAEFYKANAQDYINQIQELDNEFEQVANNSKTNKIAFGGAFAYAYFIERYNLDFATAYEACGENVEPSAMQVKKVVEYIRENNLPVIFYKEYTTGKYAKTISEATGAKMLVFNTVHNLSKQEIDEGATYVSIMRENLENLKQALN